LPLPHRRRISIVISQHPVVPSDVAPTGVPGARRTLVGKVELRYPEAEVDGFTIGMFVSYGDVGDAWVRAPDGGIGGLFWPPGEPESFEVEISASPDGRWGTFAVQLPLPLTSHEEGAEYLRALLPTLRTHWEAWKGVPRFRSGRQLLHFERVNVLLERDDLAISKRPDVRHLHLGWLAR
jgi:hypothetical protein